MTWKSWDTPVTMGNSPKIVVMAVGTTGRSLERASIQKIIKRLDMDMNRFRNG